MASKSVSIVNGTGGFPLRSNFSSLPIVEVYGDETGCRGFGPKATDWFAMSAIMIPSESVPQMRATVKGMKVEINTTRPLHWVEHFNKTKKHVRRREMAANMAAAIPGVKVIYVVVDKRNLRASSRMRSDKDLFYHYTTRLLLERVANQLEEWDGGPRKGIVRLGAVKGMNHATSVSYLNSARSNDRLKVPWDLIAWPPKWVGTDQYDGVQLADLYLGMFRWAMERGGDDIAEARYLLQHWHQLRSSTRGRILGYGVKVYGEDAGFVTRRGWWRPQN